MSKRNCLECVHCWFSGYERGYSEWTPSSPMSVECSKGHWAARDDSWAEAHSKQDAARRYSSPPNLDMARTYPDFQPEEWAS